MEMPIQIIITLFIAIAVGSMVLAFSGQLLGKSEINFGNDQIVTEEKLVEVDSMTSMQLAILIKSCYENSDNKVFKNETCYVIHSNEDFKISGEEIKNISIIKDNKDFNVSITNAESTNSAIISWNFIKQEVEVKK